MSDKNSQDSIFKIIYNNLKIIVKSKGSLKSEIKKLLSDEVRKCTALPPLDKSIQLNSLSPSVLDIEKDNSHQTYIESIYWGICNKDTKNIALMGTYGTGKSSIIKTLKIVKKDNLPVHITISLATFEISNSKSDCDSDSLSMNIVNQILYSKRKKDVSESRFKRIEYLSTSKKIFYLLSSLLFTYSFIYVFFPDISNKLAFLPSLGSLTNVFFKFTIFIGLGIFFWKSSSILLNLKISKISPINIELDTEESTKSVNALDKYFDEILYFFQATKTKVVFIEDLDRFKNSLEVFTKLRDLNFLLNQSEDLNGNITFVYAVKDDVIDDYQGKAKFFDLIIPVVPYINYSNSRDEFKKQLERIDISFKDNLRANDLINLVSQYIEDTRTILTIINEYIIITKAINAFNSVEEEQIENDSKVNVTVHERKSRFLAMVIYKTLYPDDYSRLLQRKGVLYELFSKREQVIAKVNTQKLSLKTDIEKEIKELEYKENITENSLINLRKIFITGIIRFFEDDIGRLKKELSINKIEDLILDNIFEKTVINKKIPRILVKSGVNPKSYSLDSIERIVGIKYFEEVSRIDQRDRLKEELNKVNNEIIKNEILELSDLLIDNKKVIYNHIQHLESLYCDKKITIEDNDTYNGSYDVLVLMLEESFIKEDFIYYVSHDYEGMLSLTDQEFKHKFEHNEIDVNYKVSNPKVLLEEIGIHNYKKQTILNHSLLNEIYGENHLKFQRYKTALLQSIKIYFAINSNTFFKELKEEFSYLNKFYDDLIKHSIFLEIIDSEKVVEENKIKIINSLNECSEESLGTLHSNDDFKNFMLNTQTNYLNEIDLILFTLLISKFEYILEDCSLIKDIDKLSIIVENKAYVLSIANVKYLAEKLDRVKDGYQPYSLTNILSNDDNYKIKEYFEEDNSSYLSSYKKNLEDIDGDIKEDENIIIKNLLTVGNLDQDVFENIADKIDFKITSLGNLYAECKKTHSETTINYMPILLIHNRVLAVWNNIYHYWNHNLEKSKTFDEHLNSFIKSNLNNLTSDDFDNIDDQDFKYALINSSIDDTIILNVLENSLFKISDITKLSTDNNNLIKSLIKTRKFEFSEKIFEGLNDEQKLFYLVSYNTGTDSILELNLDCKTAINSLIGLIDNKHSIKENFPPEKIADFYKNITEYLLNRHIDNLDFQDNIIVDTIYRAIKDTIKPALIEQDQYDHLMSNLISSEINDEKMKNYIEFFLEKTSNKKIVEYCEINMRIAFNYLDVLNNTEKVDLIFTTTSIIIDDHYKQPLSVEQVNKLINSFLKYDIPQSYISSKDITYFLKEQLNQTQLDLELKVRLLTCLEKYLEDQDLNEVLNIFNIPTDKIQERKDFRIDYDKDLESLLEQLSPRLDISIQSIPGEEGLDELKIVFLQQQEEL